MKYWIINNTKFGYKNNSKEWLKTSLDYFYMSFIPFLKKNAKTGDKLVHLGNIFNSSENINILTLLKVKELFNALNDIIPVIILDGYNEKTGITNILNIKSINSMYEMDNVKFISNKNPLEYITTNDDIVFINNRIDTNLLKKYSNTLFFCGYHDNNNEEDNIINVGSPYQFDNVNNCGYYVLDIDSKKYKHISNNYSAKYNTITITDISQIDDIDEDFVNNNKVNIIIDKTLIDEKTLKIDVLLSKYNFKSITYKNDIVKTEFIDNSSINMEDLIREKIKDNDDLINEFNNILSIYRERY
jgi:hypothetical protein